MVTKTKAKTKKKVEDVKETKEEKYDWEAEQAREASERKIKKLIKIVIGLLFCVGGLWLIATFWQNFLGIFKAWIGPGVILIGLFIILLGMLD